MQKQDNPLRTQPQPLAICQRIFNFFANSLIPWDLKRITLGPADDHHRRRSRNEMGPVGEQLPISLSLEKLPNVEEKRDHRQAMKDDPGHEIQVHFTQTEEEELEHWTAADKLGSSVHEIKKDNPNKQPKSKRSRDNIPIPSVETAQPMSRQQPVVKEELARGKPKLPLVEANGIASSASPEQGRSKSLREMERNSTTVAQGKGRPKKAVSVKDGGTDAGEDKGKNKGKEIAAASEKLAAPMEEKKEPKMRFPMHLISVASNINEKSDAFIRIKKEEMKKYSS